MEGWNGQRQTYIWANEGLSMFSVMGQGVSMACHKSLLLIVENTDILLALVRFTIFLNISS